MWLKLHECNDGQQKSLSTQPVKWTVENCALFNTVQYNLAVASLFASTNKFKKIQN